MIFTAVKKNIASLKAKLILIMVSISFISFEMLAILFNHLLIRDFESFHEKHAVQISQDVVYQLEAGEHSNRHHRVDPLYLQHLYKDAGIQEFRLFNSRGREFFKKDEGPVDLRVKEVLKTGDIAHFFVDDQESIIYLIPMDNGPICQSCHKERDGPMGVISLAMSAKELMKDLDWVKRRDYIFFAVITILTGAAMTIVVNRYFLKPLRTIRRGTEAMENGKLDHRIPVTSKDEIGELSRHFNRMAETLEGSFAELADKNQQLKEHSRIIARSKKQWQVTFDSITDPIALVAEDCTIINANRAFRQTFKEYLPADKSAPKKCHELFETCWKTNCPNKMCLSGKTSIVKEVFMPKMGKIFQISLFPYSPDKNVIGAIFVCKDITEIRNHETKMMLNARLTDLGQMASSIAHEINTPLATIAVCAEGLLKRLKKGKGVDAPHFDNYLKIVEEEVQRCTRITEAILSSVRKIPDEKGSIDIHSVLNKTLEMFSALGRLKWVEVVVNYYAGGVPVIYGNEGLLKQVFVSIVANGLDAMMDKGVLTLDTGVEANTVFVRIKDTGPGILPEHLERIFEPFFTTKSDTGGTGLGLSTANRVIKQMKGRIEAASEPGRGASFKVILPL